MRNIVLTEENFIGKGFHKKTYIHPEDAQLCVKVGYSKEGCVDLEREIAYRKLRERQGLKNSILPEYFGGVQTNFGQGHVFERIVDYDGKAPLTLEYYLENEALFTEKYEKILVVVKKFKQSLFDDRVITMGLFPENVLLQKLSEEDWKGVLINDMGSAALIPLEYYIDYFRKVKVLRRWQRFIAHVEDTYQYAAVKEFCRKLR